jgi:hypothetical protein
MYCFAQTIAAIKSVADTSPGTIGRRNIYGEMSMILAAYHGEKSEFFSVNVTTPARAMP